MSKTQPKEWEISRVLNILEMDSLDRVINYEEEFDKEVTLGETLGNWNEASFMKLKIFLLSVAKNQTEKRIIELLSEGYTKPEVTKILKIKHKYLYKIVTKLRKRCLEFQKQ